ncbi:MAG TPA: histidine--tRNA ligase [Flavobacteriaceae bacterium]|nr:histidine--tRNA ligase [Flavobacteriaceae bacterium]
MSQKPTIPKGTRDFSSFEIARRNYILQIIKSKFEIYGFSPIETPSFENRETLMGKYGEEGDRLIFKILDSGDFLKKVSPESLKEKDLSKIIPQISGKALRYDLTVPFARYVVQHQNELDFPFKRYQIQNVWRADRPQKGRFREFLQCDADIVGSDSLWQEVELVQLYDRVFSELKLQGTTIKVNHRKILAGIAENIGESDKLIPFTTSLDKLDKIGQEGVKKEMLEKGISAEAISKMEALFSLSGSFLDKIEQLKKILSSSKTGMEGIAELEFIHKATEKNPLISAMLDMDVTLARGLDYYTGSIFEVLPPQGIKMGSIGGGGRYDDLTGIFGMKGLSGTGISFGLDRIYLVLEEMKLFPESLTESTKVLFLNFGEKEAEYCFKTLTALRDHGIPAELYPDAAKMKKQMNYANKRGIPFVILAGSKEMEQKKFTLKNMESGTQDQLSEEELTQKLKALMP